MLNLKQLFLLNTAQTSNTPRLIEVEKAEGVYLYGPGGEAYMDLVSGFSVSNIGHRHPAVIDAIRHQIDQYLHVTVYGEFVQAPQVNLATRLLEVLPKSFESVYFTNSGTESTEGALKIAKKFTGRRQLIAAHSAYHGSTQGALSLMDQGGFRDAYAPLLPEIDFIQFNEIEDLAHITELTAAVIIETIQGEAGVRVPSNEYLKALRARCNDVGCLLIFDEIQTGLGRTGKLFAFEHFDVVPDILLLAKGLGGGMPIGAFIASKAIMDVIKENPILGHITTFGGHPVSCAAALASLNLITKEELYLSVPKKEALLRSLLVHPKIKEIRGKGFMLSLQLSSFDEVEKTSQFCAKNGVLIDWFLHCETALRIAPPLIISEEEIRKACAVILAGLDQL
jgi:acetylornithine/N-succinyldiaminopimelate aminotransferase